MDAYPLIILSQPPYAGSGARAAVDLALSYAVFGKAPRLLLLGDGVLQLAGGQEPGESGRRSLGKVIDSLPLYDIDTLYLRAADASVRGLELSGLPAHVKCLDDDAVRQLRAGARHILSL